jgi:hypothetical protein
MEDKMKHIKKNIYHHCLTVLAGTAWTAGLLIAGSESPYMPWLNLIGFFIFFGASLLMGWQLNPSGNSIGTVIYPDKLKRRIEPFHCSTQQNRRRHSRYALTA